jgi:hypothetical protein
MTRRQFDLTALVIRLLRRIGLVWSVKLPSPELIARRRVQPAGAESGDD